MMNHATKNEKSEEILIYIMVLTPSRTNAEKQRNNKSSIKLYNIIYHLFTGTVGNSEFCGPESLLLNEAKLS